MSEYEPTKNGTLTLYKFKNYFLLWKRSQAFHFLNLIIFIVQVQASVALKRIDLFMNRDELDSKVEVEQNSPTTAQNGSTNDQNRSTTGQNGQSEKSKESDENQDNAIEIDDASFAWESDQVQ